MLLIPPSLHGNRCKNIREYANVGVQEWERFWFEVTKAWTLHPNAWLSTEGHGVNYLHIRFETIELGPKYPLPRDARLL